MFRPGERRRPHVDGGFDLHTHHPAIGRFEQEIDFLAVAISPVVKQRFGLGPGELSGQLAGHKGLEQLPRDGGGRSSQSRRAGTQQRRSHSAVKQMKFLTFHDFR